MIVETPKVEKQQFRNESGGFIGVVKINAKGEELGAAVEPGDTVWLTLDEQIATANAPREAKDNPFLTQTFQRVNPETSEIESYELTPLVPISESRYVPAGDRPVPGLQSGDPAPTPEGQGAMEPPPSEPDPAPPTAREMQPPQPPTRAAAAAAEAAAAAAQAPPAPEPTEEAPVQEETAQEAPTGAEETGAAAQPTGPAVEGEFAAHEEVGVPGGDPTPPGTTPGVAGPPAPWSPGSESEEDAVAANRVPPPDPSGE